MSCFPVAFLSASLDHNTTCFLFSSNARCMLYCCTSLLRRPFNPIKAERNRTMGKRQRELRVELERREKEAANGSSPPPFGKGGGLGAGGEARVAAAKLDELRKKGEAERQRQSADWSVKSANAKSASAKKRRSSDLSGASGGGENGDDDGLEERTLRVKWKTRKESHSDYTLDVLFTKFGVVQSVSIEEGKGDRALVVFASAASADAAMAAYGDRESSESMRASYVGKRRPKRSAFAPRRQTMSPRIPASAGSAVGDKEESLSSFRDRESVVMMNLRKEAERQALMRKMVDEEGLAMDSKKGGGAAATASATSTTAAGASGAGSGGGSGDPPSSSKGAVATAGVDPASASGESGDVGGETTAATSSGERAQSAPSGDVAAGSGMTRDNRPAFPVPSPMAPRVAPAPNDLKARRRSDVLLPSMVGSGAGISAAGFGAPSPAARRAFGVGSKSMPTTPVSGGSAARIDEGDILARMMAMKR